LFIARYKLVGMRIPLQRRKTCVSACVGK